MSEKTIEEQLNEKRGVLEGLIAEMRHKSVVPEYLAVNKEVLRLERLVAQKRGEPYAALWHLPEIWEGMTLDCTVLGDQLKCFVVYEAKLKSGNFKTLAAHALSGRGLGAYGAFVIENSPWIKELEHVDRKHSNFDSQKWRKIRHYMLCFKDRIFEAMATDVTLAGQANSREIATRAALDALIS
ncbi:MAG TPA: hypothetical protein VH280_11345 [Verrucomicrobiae bacterium]|jgi:hypothetical protein|nr:hypothetical protein [Verrucomicrobiae bacterium]